MKSISLRKYEIIFLIVASLGFTIANNLSYYSMLFFAPAPNVQEGFGFFHKLYSIIWYTSQCFFSLIILSFTNYYLGRYIFKKLNVFGSILILLLINLVLSFLLFKLSMFVASITIGFPFGEKGARYYYMWKYIYMTPSAILVAYILNLIVNKKITELKNAKLIEENLSNQLKTLKDQVRPHFLFNTLNTLSSVIRTQEKEEGLKFVDDLSNVYRYILENSKTDLIHLSEEIGFINSFVRLLTKRFADNLQVNVMISDSNLGTWIPPMTLQLLIDNAVKHNEISESRPLKISINDHKNQLIISNNIQEKPIDTSGLGVGLQNLTQRYKIIADKDIYIEKTDSEFIVKLPIIKTNY